MQKKQKSMSSMRETALGLVFVLFGMSTAIPIAQAQGPNIVNSVRYPTTAQPFEAVVANSGHVLVSLRDESGGTANAGIEVFAPQANGGILPSCVNRPTLSPSVDVTRVLGMGFLPGATDLVAAAGEAGAIFYHVADLLECNATGYLVGQGGSALTLDSVSTLDGQFAFVANEKGAAPNATLASGITLDLDGNSCTACQPPIIQPETLATLQGNIGVVRILRDSDGNFTGSQLVGNISTGGELVTGILLSPDGTRLYVTSQESRIDPTSSTQPAGNIDSASGYSTLNEDCSGVGNPNGLVTVIDVSQVEASPSPPPQAAILSTVAAGCEPVRLAMTRDGRTLWVAARADNRVIAFDAAKLETAPTASLIGSADTGGTAPVGIELFHNDQWLAVANSNRYAASCTVDAAGIAQPATGTTNATILDVTSPESVNVVQAIPTGCFPRNITVGPDDASLYLTNFNSNTLQVIQATDVSFSSSSQVVNEGGIVTVTLTLGRPLPYAISIPLVASGTATKDGDYSLAQQNISIAAGATSGSTTVNAVNDLCKEGSEVITLTLGDFPGFIAGNPVSQDITIADDPSDNNLCIDGHLYNADGSPVPNKPVTFYTQDGSIQRIGYTDANGYFIARTPNWVSTDVPPETYLIWWYSLHQMINWSASSGIFINVEDTSVGNLKYYLK